MSMEVNKYRFLDIGGGAELYPGSDFQTLVNNTNNLRAVRLAGENSDKEYIIFDLYIPKITARQKARELPNLHFVVGQIAAGSHIPFADASMDRVEMNHMFTPLNIDPRDGPKPLFRAEYPVLYDIALREASRVLKPGGVLSLTEKKERIDRILELLTHEDHYDWMMMERLRLGRGRYSLVEVTDKNRTLFTSVAFREKQLSKEHGYGDPDELTIFSLELTKDHPQTL